MNRKLYLTPAVVFLSLLYLLVLYLIFAYYRIVDFTPFYISSKSLIYGINPYPASNNIPANLNPPFFLFLFYPLGLLNYKTAMIISSILSICLGLIAVRLAFYYAFSAAFLKKYNLILYLLYFSFYPVLMDTSIVQVGSILFFFVMVGYHFYLQKNDYLAGFFWGIIIAIKLFPGLLFFYVFKQRRQRVFLIMAATSFLAILLPLLAYGPTIYKQYFRMVSLIYWYGDSWNASIYGYIFRLFMDLTHPGKSLLPIESLYLLLFFMALIVYLLGMGPKNLQANPEQINHQPFCLTLTMMILMSPFGWLYYFPLLVFPLLLTGLASFQQKTKTLIRQFSWVLCFLLLNFPLAYATGKQMQNFIEKISLYSFSFYGLVLLALLVLCRSQLKGNSGLTIHEIKQDDKLNRFAGALLISIAFGLVVPLNSFLMRISLGGPGTYKNSDLDKMLKRDKVKLWR